MRLAYGLALGALLSFGCNPDSPPSGESGTTCNPGQQISCPCPGGAPDGTQVCEEDGSGYGPCDCTDPTAGSEASESGDGDGDTSTSTSGDGDSSTTTGDGDGDGDSSTTTGDGDGDGDSSTTTGDGDGDGDGCSDACDTVGEKQCADGTTLQTCTLDTDSVCNVWDDVDCSSAVQNGVCDAGNPPMTQASCIDGCISAGESCDSVGATECSGNTLRTCTTVGTAPACDIWVDTDCTTSVTQGTCEDNGPSECVACGGAQAYAGLALTQGSPNWSSVWEYGGYAGTSAGHKACEAIGADHVCSYAEVESARANGELDAFMSGNPGGEFWVHRLTTVNVMGTDYPPGAGARCNEWSYPTNHVADSEFGTISGDGTDIVYTFDSNACYTGNSQDGCAGAPGQCGGAVPKKVLCCFPACVP